MKVIEIKEDIVRGAIASPTTWVEAGVYPVIKKMGKDRVLIDITRKGSFSRVVTCVYKTDGKISEVFKT